jgi:AraC-like DNA-binding protein
VTSGLAELILRFAVDVEGNTDPAIDLGVAIACGVLRTLCGPGWAPVEILMARRAPVSREPYDRFFGAPVQFGREHNAVAFPATWLRRRVHGANPAKRKLLQRELAVVAQRHRLPAAAMTQRALASCMARGDVSVEAVAASVGLHPRTLNRRLAREGTSVFELLKKERYRIARDLLANTPLPISEVAATLLYSSVGNFTRAFHGWSHESPSDWRMKRGPGRDGHER